MLHPYSKQFKKEELRFLKQLGINQRDSSNSINVTRLFKVFMCFNYPIHLIFVTIIPLTTRCNVMSKASLSIKS